MPDKTPEAKLGKGRSEAAVAKILATGTVAEYILQRPMPMEANWQ